MENATSIPSELVLVIQSIIILFIAGEAGFKEKFKVWNTRRKAKQKAGEKMLKQVFNLTLVQHTIRTATPLILAALGGLLTEHAGMLNIGMEGMIL